MNPLLMTFYGDDFTGSTDAMEALVLGGVPAVLFLEPPSAEFVAQHFPTVRAVGVAGLSRSMTPAQMDEHLPGVFHSLHALNAPLFHYKICSTFDSSPTVGSIGHAIELGWPIFQPSVIPLMVGAPALKRYVAFGNLFATIGDETYRLDRHPTMSRHPITPMHESDLRLHLGQQTMRTIGLMDVRHLADEATLSQRFAGLIEDGCEIILFDTMDESHLPKIGRLVWEMRDPGTIFTVASSGIEYALTAYWKQAGVIEPPVPPVSPGAVEQLIVISGSASPQTSTQIKWALANGFYGIRLDSAALIDPATADQARQAAFADALQALSSGRNVLLYSTIGSTDPAIQTTNERMAALGFDPKQIGSRLGAQQGILLRELLEKTGLRRACVAGGDTCGHATHQLGVYALEYMMPIAPGSPLCRARSHNPAFDGLEISLKAGQVGKPDYFHSILLGEVR
ncbi:MAG: four-carbon acid sugar kinase family protein [bacterium]|nr:four-carbon acid sugar kinase family protein [bacterium]